MSTRQFKDCDGDTWTETSPGELELTVQENGSNSYVGISGSIEDTVASYGPLTEIRPDVDVRALLAEVLEELAEELRRTTDLPGVLTRKARALRGEAAGGEPVEG